MLTIVFTAYFTFEKHWFYGIFEFLQKKLEHYLKEVHKRKTYSQYTSIKVSPSALLKVKIAYPGMQIKETEAMIHPKASAHVG